MIAVETGGNCGLKGASGESGCLQYLPSVWEDYSKRVTGEIIPMTNGNEYYVAVRMIEHWLDSGIDETKIPLMWNQGNAGKCIKGINGHGVKYDSCAHQQKVLAVLYAKDKVQKLR